MADQDDHYKKARSGLLIPRRFQTLNDPGTRKRNIGVFTPVLKNSPRTETMFVSYYDWHEEREDFNLGRGVLHSLSYKETHKFWMLKTVFVPYEGSLYSFCRNGFEVRRIFSVSEGQLYDHKEAMAFKQVIWRHIILGFQPRFIARSEHLKLMKELEVDCDTLGTINEKIALLIRYDTHDEEPAMLRTTKESFASKLSSVLNRHWNKAGSVDDFWKRYDPPSPDIKKAAQEDADYILRVAR